MADEFTQKLLEKIMQNFNKRCSDHPMIQQVEKKVLSGKADLIDIDHYAGSIGAQLSQAILESVDLTEFESGRMYLELSEDILTQTLKNNYELVNKAASRVQKDLDSRLNFMIKSQKAKFPLDRVKKIASSLCDPAVSDDTVRRRMTAPIENITRSFYTDYVESNAQFRNDAGLKCYLVRETDGECCKWCSKIAGRYIYGEHPDDIFRRHDNCSCTVTYENGRTRQNVWTKRTWEAPDTPKNSVNPTVIPPEKAKDLQAKNLPESLTNIGNGGIIRSRRISGALNPDSPRAQDHADKYYESVRHMKTDVKRISENVDFSEYDIAQIKNHIFMQKHDLGNSEPEYFYPCYEMAESWQRLIDGRNIQKHDITMLNHEKMEHELMEKGYSQYEAHKITEEKFNYGLEAKKYYAEINKHKKE